MNGLQGLKIFLLAALSIFIFAGCSGGGGGDDGIDGTGLEGTAAVGMALSNADVTIKDVKGAKRSTKTNENGFYKFDVSDMQAPFLIKVKVDDDKSLFSIQTSVKDKNKNTANIHPISDVAARNWFKHRSRDIEIEFDNDQPIDNPPGKTDFEALKDALTALLRLAYADFGVDSGFDFIDSPFNPNGSGFDALLDNATIVIKDNKITITIKDPKTGFIGRIIIKFELDDDLAKIDTQAPDPITGFKVVPASSTEMLVVWDAATDNVGVAGYNVYWGTDNSVSGGIAHVPYPVFQHEGLTPNQQYCYKVEAVDKVADEPGNVSPQTAVECKTTPTSDDNTPPTAPLDLNATDTQNSSIQLNWTGSSDAIGYFVYRSENGATEQHIATVLVTSFEDIGVVDGVDYCYTVTAVNGALNESTHSNSDCTSASKVNLDIDPPVSSVSHPSGVYSSLIVTLNCSDGTGSGCGPIYYTTDGATPTTSSAVYSGPINITTNTTLNFFAVDNVGNEESPHNSVNYVIDSVPPVSSATPTGGAYYSIQMVSLSCTDNSGLDCGSIYYTTDGSVPTTASTQYSAGNPIQVNASMSISFFAVDQAGNQEAVNTENYVITIDVAAPTTTISPTGGFFPAAGGNVAVSCGDAGGSGCAETRCTTDGSVPDGSSSIAQPSYQITATTELRCFSVDNAGNVEAAVTETYTIDSAGPVTSVDQVGGSYPEPGLSVTVSCDDGGGSGCGNRYCTTDGSAPTTGSPVITAPVNISSDTTLRCMSVDLVGNQGPAINEQYTIIQPVEAPVNTTPANYINSGDASVEVTNVLASISATDDSGVVAYMIVDLESGNTPTTPTAVTAGWTAIASTISYNAVVSYNFSQSYPSGTSVCLYVWFLDDSDRVSNRADDCITYEDLSAPVNTTGNNFIDGGAPNTNDTSVNLQISATDVWGVTAYYIADNISGVEPVAPNANDSGWINVTTNASFSANVAYQLTDSYQTGDPANIYVWFKDAAGHVSTSATDSINIELSVFRETFESGQGLWFADNGVWEVGAPSVVGPSACYEGTQCAATVLAGNYPGVDSIYASPSINLPAINTATEELQLRFWHWFSIQGNDQVQLLIRTSSGPGTWNAWETLRVYNNSSAVWTRTLVNIAAYAGQRVQIGFMLNYSCCGAAPGWYVDDISIDRVSAPVDLSAGQSYLENFEGGLAGWSAENGAWEVGEPTTGPGAAHSGTQVAATVLAGSYPGNDSFLVSPTIQLPVVNTAAEELQLRFWHWFSIQGNDDVRLMIRTETATAGVWNAWELLATYTNSSGVWNHALYNIAAYSGQKVQLGFFMNYSCCGAADGWYIDDVTIDLVAAPIDLTSSSYLEDFESGLGGWSIYNGSWEIGEPTSGPGNAHSGTQVAATVLGGDYPGNDSYLVSPSLLLPAINPATDELQLRFWHWFSIQGNDDMRVLIRTESVTPGIWNAWQLLDVYTNSSAVWTRPMINLHDYAGMKVQIGFFQNYSCCGAAPGWYVDDVTVEVVNAPIVLTGGLSYLEDFESGLGNWSVHNGAWEVGIPTSGPGAAHSGDQVGATVLAGNYPGNDSYLISPTIILPTIDIVTQELHFRFWHWFSIQGNDDVRAVIRTEASPGVWNAWEFLGTYTGSSGVWTQPLINLSAYSGQKVQVGFFLNYSCCGAAAGWYVDDVTINVFNF